MRRDRPDQPVHLGDRPAADLDPVAVGDLADEDPDLHLPQRCYVPGHRVGLLCTGLPSGYTNSGGTPQFYTVTDIDDSGNFSGVEDVSDLAHEVGEWMDDPSGTNPDLRNGGMWGRTRAARPTLKSVTR